MTQKNLALVSGANGHLGNNLVRFLLEKGIPVRASVRNYPGILHHVPLTYIASFLGMKPESLSRIRRKK